MNACASVDALDVDGDASLLLLGSLLLLRLGESCCTMTQLRRKRRSGMQCVQGVSVLMLGGKEKCWERSPVALLAAACC